ncbi:PiggyBac transposable element-derived protein 4 [Smittium culicis]|uniref:PiggyBac transposable element-derived protein 4 n=1 Tax=Smittium culicis TaxID=133412 RepID=A0A1R1YJL9_9FUNG|nr:PiggyBac transposable element-derived protein 4 [Smittium culicis]
MDNFFTSVPLMEYLKKIGHYACGTIRPNRRHLPEFSKNNRLRKWDTEWYMNENGISVLKWMDSKPVHMISTYHGPSILSRIPRRSKSIILEGVIKHEMICDYNLIMNSVDKQNQLNTLYGLDRKCYK